MGAATLRLVTQMLTLLANPQYRSNTSYHRTQYDVLG